MSKPKQWSHFARGFSLVEILVSLVILVFGVTGAAMLQLRSITTSQGESYRALASQLATDMANRIESSNGQGAQVYNNVKAYLPGGSASLPDFASYVAWQTKIQNRLPSGQSVVCKTASPALNTIGGATCDANQSTSNNPIAIMIWWVEKTSTYTASDGNVRTTSVAPSAATTPSFYLVLGI